MASPRVGESGESGVNGAHIVDNASSDPDPDEEYYSVLRYPDNLDYYSLLGVSREQSPTDSELRSAYHNLTLSFHPDKQPAHLVEVAKTQFRRIQDAYETLIDPKKRIVYDMEGEEGVRREWGSFGIMGKLQNEDDSLGQVGPRAMPPAEFRQWFLGKMKAKEREALDSMVGSRATMSIGLDASSLISPGEEKGDVRFNVPTIRPSRYALSYTFKTRFPDLSALWTWISSHWNDAEEDDEKPESFKDSPKVTLQASIGGPIRKTKRSVEVEYADGTSRVVKVEGPPILGPATFGLNTSISHQITNVGLRTGSYSKLWSLLDRATIGSDVGILPSRTLTMYIAKAVYPFPHGKTFNITINSTMPSYPNLCMPILAASVTRKLGIRTVGSLTYSSGTHMWPSFIQNILSTFMHQPISDAEFLLAKEVSSLQLKYIILPEVITVEESERLGDMNSLTRKESWQWTATASPQGGLLTLNYARTLFADKIEDPPRSDWSLDGYHSIPFPSSRRGVRIEAEATVDIGANIGWSVSALRRVGKVSTIGLGFTLQDRRGLIMTFTWRSLGQSIKVPVAICPMDLADTELCTWIVMVPWVTYVGLEYGYIRPRERRRRRQAIIRKRKLLKSQIQAYKRESEEQIEMMQELVQRRQEREKSKGGLYVEKAEYGYLPSKKARHTGDEFKEPKLIDVTIPVAAQVDKSQLFISKHTIRFQIIGFYDPAPLLPKILRVWYTFHGEHHYAEAFDGEDLACPQREHMDLSENS